MADGSSPLHMHQRPSPRPVTSRLAFALAAALVAAPALGQAPCPDGMRALAGGRFTLADGSEAVEVGALCLDATEVTAAAFAACVARGACQETGLRCGKAATYGDRAKERHPVNCVSWLDADRYCRAQGKRLPTEAEWEWAARGQLRAQTYPWGSAPPADRACWDGAGSTLGQGGRNETCAAGAFPAGDSPDGVHDLGGNVREWTASRVGRDRVVRGGSWGDSLPSFLAAGFRGMNAVDERFELTGFRCAATPGLLAEPRAAPVEVPLPRSPGPAEPPAGAVAALGTSRAGQEGAAQETVVAPKAQQPTPAGAARPGSSRAAQAPPPAPAGPLHAVEIGEIRVEPLTGWP